MEKQEKNVVSRSSAELEYRATVQSIGFSFTRPTKLWCDNQVALHIAPNPIFHERTKHIEVDRHFICEKIEVLISTAYVKTEDQLGDILTKVGKGVGISYLCNKIGMIDIFAPA